MGLQTPARSAAIAALPFHRFAGHWRPNGDHHWVEYPLASRQALIVPLHKDNEKSSVVSLRPYEPTWSDAVALGKSKPKMPRRDGPVIVTALIAKSQCSHVMQDLWTFRYIFRPDALVPGGSTTAASGVGLIHVGPFEPILEAPCIRGSQSPLSTPSTPASSSRSSANFNIPGCGSDNNSLRVVGPSNQGRFAVVTEPVKLCHASNPQGSEHVVPTENIPGLRTPRNVSIEPWSGAVVFYEPGFVVVRYYD